MSNKMKGLVKFVAVVAIVVLVLCLVKYLNAKSYFEVNDGNKLMLRVPNLTHLSPRLRHLSGCQYQLSIENVCFGGFAVLLTSWRMLLLRKVWK